MLRHVESLFVICFESRDSIIEKVRGVVRMKCFLFHRAILATLPLQLPPPSRTMIGFYLVRGMIRRALFIQLFTLSRDALYLAQTVVAVTALASL